MSTPPFVDLPIAVHAVRLPTAGGPLAALRVTPGVRTDTAPRGTALLIPGYTGSKEDFIGVLAPLAAAGFDVVAIDQRGQNQSPGADPADRPDAYTLGRLGNDLLEVLDHLGVESVHLLGHSFGGLVARETALAAPQRIRSLCLLDSGPAAIPGRSGEQAKLLVAAAGFLSSAEIWAEIKKIEAAENVPQHPDPRIRAFLEERFVANDPAMLVGMGTEIITAPDRTAELAALGLPMLVAAGVGDDAWPLESQQEMAIRLGTELVLIEDAAHSPAAENPDRTAQILAEFWSRAEHRG
jgi:pimeloyl-ACP methyl ester carboxylesterase